MITILVPSDLSANALKALEYAVDLSTKLNAGIIVYHCMLKPPSGNEQAEKLQELKAHVSQAYQNASGSNIPAGTKIFAAFNPMMEESILEYAEKENADLIIMGTHGSSGIKTMLFGSNTSNIIARSDKPVLAIPAQYVNTGLQKIMFCSELKNLKEEMNELMPLIGSLKTTLEVIYFDYGTDPDGTLVKNAKALLAEAPYKDVIFTSRPATIEYSLNQQIREYLQQSPADCLVMVTHERSGWDRIFKGSKTEDMAESLNIPLLSIKKGKAVPAFSY